MVISRLPGILQANRRLSRRSLSKSASPVCKSASCALRPTCDSDTAIASQRGDARDVVAADSLGRGTREDYGNFVTMRIFAGHLIKGEKATKRKRHATSEVPSILHGDRTQRKPRTFQRPLAMKQRYAVFPRVQHDSLLPTLTERGLRFIHPGVKFFMHLDICDAA
uniref:Uncharacterized protein n=1 Tax=Steinernema glaseri TaxID=37863 RepID=A0A1I7XXW6_9BILA